jgi:hypothetical protein
VVDPGETAQVHASKEDRWQADRAALPALFG